MLNSRGLIFLLCQFVQVPSWTYCNNGLSSFVFYKQSRAKKCLLRRPILSNFSRIYSVCCCILQHENGLFFRAKSRQEVMLAVTRLESQFFADFFFSPCPALCFSSATFARWECILDFLDVSVISFGPIFLYFYLSPQHSFCRVAISSVDNLRNHIIGSSDLWLNLHISCIIIRIWPPSHPSPQDFNCYWPSSHCHRIMPFRATKESQLAARMMLTTTMTGFTNIIIQKKQLNNQQSIK